MTQSQASARGRTGYATANAGFNAETREAVNSAFDALSEWRQELVESADRNGTRVFDKMASAAKSMGWPSEVVEAARDHMMKASKMQLQVLDQVMDLWEQQVKSPGAGFDYSAALQRFPMFPAPGLEGQMFSMPDMRTLGAMNPVQFWMQAADMWQKNWATAMSSWMGSQPGSGGRPNGGSR